MADLFAGAAAVIDLVDGLTKTVAHLRRMRDAPKQLQDFEERSFTFCETMRMLHIVTGQYSSRFREKAKKHVRHIDGLLRQGKNVLKGAQTLLSELRGLRKNAQVKPWKVWWQKAKWVLKEHPVTRLEGNLKMAYAATSTFIGMLSLTMNMDRLEDPSCTGDERQRLGLEISILKRQLKASIKIADTYKIHYQQIEDRMPRLERQEADESNSIMKDLRNLERSVKRVQRQSQQQGDRSTASTSQRSSDISNRPIEEERQPIVDCRVQQLYLVHPFERSDGPVEESYISDSEDDGPLVHPRDSRLSILELDNPIALDLYISSSEDDREGFPFDSRSKSSEPSPSPEQNPSDDAYDDSGLDLDTEHIKGARVIDNGSGIRVEHGLWSVKVEREDGAEIDFGEGRPKNSQTQSPTRSMNVKSPGSDVVIKRPADNPGERGHHSRSREVMPDTRGFNGDPSHSGWYTHGTQLESEAEHHGNRKRHTNAVYEGVRDASRERDTGSDTVSSSEQSSYEKIPESGPSKQEQRHSRAHNNEGVMAPKEPAQLQSGEHRFLDSRNHEGSLKPDRARYSRDPMRHDTRSQSDLGPNRHSIHDQNASQSVGNVSNDQSWPRFGQGTVERRNTNRESFCKHEPPSGSKPDTPPRENGNSEYSQREKGLRDKESDVVCGMNCGQKSEERLRETAVRSIFKKEIVVKKTDGRGNNEGAVQISPSQLLGFYESSARSRSNGRASEMRMPSLSNGSDYTSGRSSSSELYVEKSEAEPSNDHRGSPRNENTGEFRINVGEDRNDTETPQLSIAEARAKFQNAPGDYKTWKKLKKLAEERKRDTRGVVTGDPEDDDEYERRQRWARRR